MKKDEIYIEHLEFEEKELREEIKRVINLYGRCKSDKLVEKKVTYNEKKIRIIETAKKVEFEEKIQKGHIVLSAFLLRGIINLYKREEIIVYREYQTGASLKEDVLSVKKRMGKELAEAVIKAEDERTMIERILREKNEI